MLIPSLATRLGCYENVIDEKHHEVVNYEFLFLWGTLIIITKLEKKSQGREVVEL